MWGPTAAVRPFPLRKGKGSKDNTSVSFSGAVGMNSIDNTIEAAVRNSTLTGVKSLDIEALSGGTSVASGTAPGPHQERSGKQ